MKKIRTTPQTRAATAYHEAGHMLAAWHFGLKIRRATIVPAGDYMGLVRHENVLRGFDVEIDQSDRALIRVGKLIQILLAGPIAQRRHRPSSLRHYHGQSDHALAADMALRMNSSEEMTNAYMTWISLRTEALVRGQWEMVELFANRLLTVNTLGYGGIQEVIAGKLRNSEPENL